MITTVSLLCRMGMSVSLLYGGSFLRRAKVCDRSVARRLGLKSFGLGVVLSAGVSLEKGRRAMFPIDIDVYQVRIRRDGVVGITFYV